jgi:hypothetical protein
MNLDFATYFADFPLRCICREYPNKMDHVLNGPEDVRGPREVHPAFYGCFDWHSSVHGHWMLVKLLKQFKLPQAELIRSMIHSNMSRENLLAEAAYLDQPGRQSFERMYGWAWLLKLAEELHGWDDPDGVQWAGNLKPLEEKIVDRYLDFLPKQAYPIRIGTHTNTAFGLSFAYDYAVTVGNTTLRHLIVERAIDYFGADQYYSCQGEPSGADFLSPTLVEADLMRRILSPKKFENWFGKFLTDLSPVLKPVNVADREDPQIGHLDGLNLSRAWCMKGISEALPKDNPLKAELQESAELHTQVGLANVQSGNYNGEHWLASFAVYLLTLGK